MKPNIFDLQDSGFAFVRNQESNTRIVENLNTFPYSTSMRTYKAIFDAISSPETSHFAGPYPTSLFPEAGDYVGYYQNVHGEELIFIARASRKDAILVHSDLGWQPVPVVADGMVIGITLNAQERNFVKLSWETAKFMELV